MTKIRKPKPGQSLAEACPDIAVDFASDLNGMDASEIGKGSMARVWWRCSKCGTEWEAPVIRRTSTGTGCPKCAVTRHRKTHEQFVTEVAERNPKVEVIGKYVNQRTKVALRCVECGHEWMAYPSNTLNGQACPKCAEKRFDRPKKDGPRKKKVVDMINHDLYVKKIDEVALAHLMHKAYVLPPKFAGFIQHSFYVYAFEGDIEFPGQSYAFSLDERLPHEPFAIFKEFLVNNGENPEQVEGLAEDAWREMEALRDSQLETFPYAR